MIVKLFNTGIYGTNTYVVGCEKSKLGAVIDPADDAQCIIDFVNEQGLDIKYILLTHGHFDHIGAVDEIKKNTNAEICIHQNDAEMLKDPEKNLSTFVGKEITVKAYDKLIKENDKLIMGKYEFEILHTPGHTPGGISIKTKDYLFTGDTLFENSIGRTDFPNGNHELLISSIKNKLCILDPNLKVLPGHGGITSLKKEIEDNPFLK